MFVRISPNINWENTSDQVCTRHLFTSISWQIHLSASSSKIGKDVYYFNKSVVGGSAILTFGLWSLKVIHSFQDPFGHGTYTVTTIQGKHNKKVSAYITVQKGSDIGIDTLYAQQVTQYERECIKSKISPNKKICPRKEAMLRLDSVIHLLQAQNHAIILMLDANQAHQDCFLKSSIRPYSIEWLRIRRGLDDPFVTLTGCRPNSTTQTPCRDIDYVLTFSISIDSISTIPINCPAMSDHLGIILDIDLENHFFFFLFRIAEP